MEMTSYVAKGRRRANPYLDLETYDPEADLMVLNLGPQHPFNSRRISPQAVSGRRDHRKGRAIRRLPAPRRRKVV